MFAGSQPYTQALMTAPFLSPTALLRCSSQHAVLTYRKATSLLLRLGFTRTPQQFRRVADAPLIPGSEPRCPLSLAWADPPPTRGLPGPGLSPFPPAMAVLWIDLFFEAPAIRYWGGERCPASQPQSYPSLSGIWPYRLFFLQSGLPRGQVLPCHLPKWLASAAARARGLVLCLTGRRTAATQGSCEPWHGGREKAPVILPS